MKIIALLITTFFAVCAEAAEVVTSASANMVLLDTTVATNDVVIAGSQSELPITYSASQWNEMDQVGQTVLVTADDDTLLETEEEGIYWWRPMRAGIYGLRHIANGVTLIKSVRFQAPEVQIERFGGNLCKLTASDGVSPIRYTLDGSDPTLGSALYGGPFEIPLSRMAFVRACTFGGGCLPGETAMASFDPNGSLVCSAENVTAIDTRAGKGGLTVDGPVGVVWSALWTSDESADVVVEVDGKAIVQGGGEGVESYYPPSVGSHVLTHTTYKDGQVVGEPLTATLELSPTLKRGLVRNGRAVIADGTTEIGTGAFAGRTNMTDVVIPNSVTNIAPTAFAGCVNLTNVALHGAVSSSKRVAPELIAGSAWIDEPETLDGDKVYRSNVISDGQLTAIEFDIPEGLDRVVFSWKVESEQNYDLLTFYLDGVQKDGISGSCEWTTVACDLDGTAHRLGFAYSKDGSVSASSDCGWVSVHASGKSALTLMDMFPDSPMAVVTIGDEIAEVPEAFFANCTAMEAVVLSGAVTNIGADAFLGCENLKRVDVPSLENWLKIELANETANPLYYGAELYADGVKVQGYTRLLSPIVYENLCGAMHTNPASYREGFPVVFTSPSERTGYAFTGWTPEGITAEMFGEQTATAGWQANTYQIEYDANGGSGTMAATACEYDREVALASNQFVRTGYAFMGWADSEDAVVAQYADGAVVSNLTAEAGGVVRLYAVYHRVKWPVVITNPDGSETVVEVEHESKQEFVAPAPTVDQDGTRQIVVLGTTYTVPMVTNRFEVTVTNGFGFAWDILATNCLFEVDETVHGVVRGEAAGWKLLGDEFTLTAAPDEHFHLVRWTGDLDGCEADGASLAVVMDRARKIGVEFAIDEFSVSFDVGAYGQRTGGGELAQSVTYGSAAVAPEVEADYGWKFIGWSSDFSCVTEDMTVVARWESLKHSESVGDVTWDYMLRDGVAVVDNNGNAAVSGMVEGEVVVPATLGGYPVAAIGAGAFRDCLDLTAVVLPQCVTALGEAAFRGCSNLVSVAIPEGVTSIPARAFMGCTALEELAIPAGVTDIGEEAFADCALLKAIDIPAGVAEIAARTFVGCAALGKVALPEDLVKIDAGAFAGCAALGSVSIPSGVVELGEGAFAGCKGLSSASFAGQPPAGIRESGLLDGKIRINGPAETVISPADRTVFATELAVTLSTEWPDGVVRYTLDGTEPTAESPEFEGISVHNKTTVRAATFVDGLRWGEIAEATYGVGKVATPVIASESGDTFYHNDNLVSLSCETKGVEIRYTLNGGEPTASSALYTAPFAISQTTIVKAKAFGHPDYVDSETATRQLVRAWEGLATPVISPAGGEYQSEWQAVSIACESEGVTVYYTLDGSRPSAANGLVYKGPFRVYRTQTVKAVATKYDWQDSEIARADFTRANALSEAVNCYGVLAKTDEAHPWTVDAANSHDGVGSARSASVEDGTSFMSLTVKGAGHLTFWWKASCEEEWEGEYYDYGSFKVGGIEQAKICGKTGWLKVSVDVKGTGKNTLKWEYAKDGETDEGEDCIWVDQVVWVPADGNGATLTSGEPVPYAWLEEYGLGADSDFETAANARTGKCGALGRELVVWEDYVTGTNPTNADSLFRAHIDMSGDKPKIAWTPDLNEGGTKNLRIYRTFGAKTLDGQWFEVNGDEEKYNFFKVLVEMK